MEQKIEPKKKIDLWESHCQRANEKMQELEKATDMETIRVLFHEYREEVKKAHGIFREIVEERCEKNKER